MYSNHLAQRSKELSPKHPPAKKLNENCYFLTPSSSPLPFFWRPQKKAFFCYRCFYRHWSRKPVSPECRIFLHSVVAICCMPIMELQFLQIKFNPIKLFCFINCSGMYFSVFDMTQIQKN